MDRDRVNQSFYQFYRTRIYLESIYDEPLKKSLMILIRDILESLDDDEKFELLFELCHTYFDKTFDEVHRVQHMEEKWGKNVSRRLGDDDPCLD